MSYDYSENILVQESSGNLLRDELGWTVEFAYNKEVLGENGTFGRKSYKEILLYRYFKAALKKLNPWINDNQVNEALEIFESRLSSATLMQINKDKYKLIRDGIPVTVKKNNGEISTRKAIVIDFNNPQNNDFLAIKELQIHSEIYRRRTDIVGFVNGIPLLFIELKKTNVDVENAYTDNYTDYLTTIPHLFYYNAFLILSSGLKAKIGTLGSKYEFFHEWKRLKEDEPGSVALETMLRGVCKKENFLDLLENFILFDKSGERTIKILAKNHQYLGVNEAVKAYEARKLSNGKLGVFWHTQGSGKSYSMVFLSQKIKRKFEGSPTIVILTDRDELNTQISDTFENCGLLGGLKASEFIASSGADLVNKLKSNTSFIFTLIQKFNKKATEPIIPDHDIIIMSDEAHRSQYGIFADNMLTLLPTASRLGFTGTPLLSSDNITERTFGGYISIYDFKRAVEDHATVPLFYENRGEKIKAIKNPNITDKILDAIEKADLDYEQEEKLQHEFEKEIHILTAEPRLRAIAQDFVTHYSSIWQSGKAMFVCLNKVTCVRMYNYVQEYWKQEISNLKSELEEVDQQEYSLLESKIKWMEETEMAVVISQEQNEIQTFKKWNLDILTHREKMEKRHLDKEFKDKDNPFRVVFVCAMWLTGFDVQCLSNLYLDKPLKAHTLMQTIARANRVAEDKTNGLIIDYVGIVKALRKALADYTGNANQRGTDPTVDKKVLIDKILEIISSATEYLKSLGFDLKCLIEAKDFKKMALLKDAANAVSHNRESKKQYMTYGSELRKYSKYLENDELSKGAKQSKDAIIAIYDQLQRRKKHVDNTDLMVQINSILNDYIEIDHKESEGTEKRFDISKINFDLLSAEFLRERQKNLVINDLEVLIQERIACLLKENPNRVNYYERYSKIINDYNKEQDAVSIEKTFMDLMKLADSLTQEEKRYVREGFSCDEELTLYDMLFKENLSKEEIKTIKKVSIHLIDKIKEKVKELDHWTDKQETKSAIDILIRDILWEELPACYDDTFLTESRQQIYEYVYSKYSPVAVL